MADEKPADPPGVPPPQAVAARPSPEPRSLHPDQLYKAVGLGFLLLVVFRFLDPILRVLLLVYAAVVLAVALNAIVRIIPVRRPSAAAAVGMLLMAAIGVAVWLAADALVQQVRGLTQQWPQFEAQLLAWQEWLRRQTGLNVQLFGQESLAMWRRTFLGDEADVIGRARGVAEVLLLPLLVLFGAVFAVGKPNERLLSPLLRVVPRDRRVAFQRMFHLLGVRLFGWVKGTMLAMLIIGALSTIAFSLLGLDYALALGLWAGLTEFLPLVGPFLGGITAVIVAFLQDPGLALWTAIIVLAIQQLESNLITPLVMSRTAEIHPFVTLFALLLFGTLFGFLGLLLALPLVLLIWTAVQVLWVERAIDTDEDPIPAVVKE